MYGMNVLLDHPLLFSAMFVLWEVALISRVATIFGKSRDQNIETKRAGYLNRVSRC